jgi:iron-sulfur cluster assembly protein
VSVTLTEAAAERVKTFLSSTPDVQGLRLGVRKTGCSGFAYVVDVAEEVGPEDSVFESCGVNVVVDGKSLPLLEGTEIDFARSGLNECFVYHNPNVKSECGCGESFGV